MSIRHASMRVAVCLVAAGHLGCTAEADGLTEVGAPEPTDTDPKADDPGGVPFTPFMDDVGARGTEAAREIFTTQEQYRDFFGHDAPDSVDFATDWVVFYSAGAPQSTNETSIAAIALPAGSDTLEVTTSLKAKGACWVVGSLFALARFPKVPGASRVRYLTDDRLVDNCEVPAALAASWSCDGGGGDPTFLASCKRLGVAGDLATQTALAWTKVVPSGMCTAAVTCPDGARVGCLGTSTCASTPSRTDGWVVCDTKRTTCSPDEEFSPGPGTSKPEALGWQPTFVDEFDDADIDRDRWTSSYYGFSADHVFVRDGHAVLAIDADDPLTPWGGRTASLNTRGLFAQQYGWFEIRAKMASAAGLRGATSAFWLLPRDGGYLPSAGQGGFRGANEPFEIDIFEQSTMSPRGDTHTLHAGNNPDFIPSGLSTDHVEGFISQTYPFDHGDGFHTYALEWTPEAMVWTIDGRRVQQSWLVPRAPFFVLLNLYQSPDVTDPALQFPLELEVNHVRVYRLPRDLSIGRCDLSSPS